MTKLNEAQKEAALKSLATYQKQLIREGHGTIATEISAAGQFYRAEEYHQKYIVKHGGDVCHFYDPHLEKI